MALLEVNLRPSDRDLRWFGVILLAFTAFLGAVIWWASGARTLPLTLVAAGGVICTVYYLVPPLRRLIYVGWMRAIFPVGWLMSHALIGFIYFGILTPIGWGLRLSGRDPMQRRMQRDCTSYWMPRRNTRPPGSYFRQF